MDFQYALFSLLIRGKKALFAEALQYGPHHFLLTTVCTEKRFRIVFFLAFLLSGLLDVFRNFGMNGNYDLSLYGMTQFNNTP
jgi:hypothetical protein